MDFKIFMDTDIKVKTFDSLTDAKVFLYEFIKSQNKHNIIVNGFIVSTLTKYVIYYVVTESNMFIDDIIDYVNQWQYENDRYVECIMRPFYDEVCTIVTDY